MFVRELQEGSPVACVLIVREAELRSRRDGGQDLRLVLGDRTGSLPAHVRDEMTFHPVMSLDEVLELALEPVAHRSAASGSSLAA